MLPLLGTAVTFKLTVPNVYVCSLIAAVNERAHIFEHLKSENLGNEKDDLI